MNNTFGTELAIGFSLLCFSFMLGRFSHRIPLRCCRLRNGYSIHKSSNAKKKGRYSSKFYANNNLEHTKLVLCVRRDLNMGKGKIAAQCSHATLGVVRFIQDANDQILLDIWANYGQPKIVTKIESLQELKDIQQNAKIANVPTYVVCDAGHTQVPSGSYTVIAVGPAPDSIINQITGHLKLL